jgi:hypothetical protein
MDYRYAIELNRSLHFVGTLAMVEQHARPYEVRRRSFLFNGKLHVNKIMITDANGLSVYGFEPDDHGKEMANALCHALNADRVKKAVTTLAGASE